MLRIYGHLLASFYWNALIALYERGVPFEFLMVDAVTPITPRSGRPPGADRP